MTMGRAGLFVLVLVVGSCGVLSLSTGCDTAGGAAAERPAALALAGNRLFDGAPPTIPHEVGGLGRHDCLDCHAEGDAVSDGRRATVTPHPELERCQQCHVSETDVALFQTNEFEGGMYPMGAKAQPMGPLLIPHPLTMRENCLGCHGSDAEEPSLRTTHPERIRCIQCHIPDHEGWPGPRPDWEEHPWRTVP